MKTAVLVIFACGTVHGQTDAARPAFAVASIKADNQPRTAGIIRPTPGALTAANTSIAHYIRWAWNLKGNFELVVPPGLQAAADTRYAIVARAEGPAPEDQIRLMLQTLLAERFHLEVHSERRDLPVFALVVAKGGPRGLREPEPRNAPHADAETRTAEGTRRWRYYNEPVPALLGILSSGLSRPIIDMTGITGAFDFTFDIPQWNPKDGPMGDYTVSDVFPEVQRQLGLRIESRTAPLDVLVVDHLDKTPIEN